MVMLTYPEIDVRPSPIHDAESARWVVEQQLVEERSYEGFLRIGCGTFAAATYPEAPPWVVQLASDLTSFLFTFDDFIAEGEFRFDPQGMRAAAAPYLDIVRGLPARVSTAYARALAELVDRGCRAAPAYWRGRLVASFEAYVEGCALEATWRQRARPPPLEAYLELRRGSVAVNPMMDLMELTHGVFLTEAEFASETTARLRRLGSDLSAFVNDIQSVEKEEALGEVCNSVIVVQHEQGLDRAGAYDAVARLHNRQLGELLDLEARLTAQAPGTALALYARSIRQFVHGHYGWILSSKRYVAMTN
jgi:Terpene synthase family 2, C-terminal metal binding